MIVCPRCAAGLTEREDGFACPSCPYRADREQGIVLFERTREVVLGLRDEPLLAPGVVAAYDFDPWRVKGPIIRTALERGWSYRPATSFGQLRRS